MPSPAARQLTLQHRRDLSRVSALVQRRMRRLAAGADVEDIDAWWRAVRPQAVELVTQGANVSAALSTRYLRQHARVEGVDLAPVRSRPNVQEISTSLRVTGPVAFKTSMRRGDELAARRTMATTLAGSAERLTLNGARSSVMDTFQASQQMTGYRRVTAAKPCAFCAMLASRGAVYSKDTVDFASHDHCNCTAEPLYRREQEPVSVQRLREQWDAHYDGDFNTWRRFWEGRAT